MLKGEKMRLHAAITKTAFYLMADFQKLCHKMLTDDN